MRGFLDENFLLATDTAVRLYHDYAAAMPIFDYHCHLAPGQIATNHRFADISDVWLGGDHYKWRAMRAQGVDEELITGKADPWEKFRAWAMTLPHTLGNPLHQWTHLELRRHFDIDAILGPETAREIFDACNAKLATDAFRVRSLMQKADVRGVCTTDDPTDDLSHHSSIAADASFDIPVVPAFRPDKVLRFDNPAFFKRWIAALEASAGVGIGGYPDLIDALSARVEYFHARGCRLSDHGIESPFGAEYSADDVDNTLRLLVGGAAVSREAGRRYCSAVLHDLGRIYARRGWTMQIHLGALRNNNARMLDRLGPDTGYDAMGDFEIGRELVALLDRLDRTGELPRTILYNLNPRDNEMLASIAGSFQGGEAGKMQLGSGWWYNDQRDGMERQMTALANIGLLGRFVGMTTDSRSFLSYPRHEYFRRVLCNLLGRWVENGEIPASWALLGDMVKNICYNNARGYFGIKLKE